MAQSNNMSRKDLLGMSNNILKRHDMGLPERGLLATLIDNEDKETEDILNELPDGEAVIEAAMQKLIDNGYVSIVYEAGEEIFRVSDQPIFLEG